MTQEMNSGPNRGEASEVDAIDASARVAVTGLPKPYYEDDFVTLYHGDSAEILSGLADDSVELVLTDPPYNCINRPTGSMQVIDKGGADSLPVDITAMATEFVRITSGTVYVWCGDINLSNWLSEFKAAGLSIRGGVWSKPNPSPMNGEKLWLSALEFCAFGRKPKAYFDEHCRPALWTYPTVPQLDGHPTPKPLRLMNEQIAASCPPGGTVLDPFAGSGTTLRAAKDLGRNSIGIEIEEKYCEIIANRCSQEVMDFGEAA